MANNRKKQLTLTHFFGKAAKKEEQKELPKAAAITEQVELMSLDTEDVALELDEQDDEEVVVASRKRKRRIIVVSEEESDSDEEPLQKRLSRLRQETTLEQCDDINDEELNFLDKSDILQERTRGKQVSRYSEALKKLADRKSKLESYGGERGPIEDYLTGSSSEEEEDFIVDDDMIDGVKKTDKDSEMTLMEMPVEFSRARAQSFTRQLSIYIEYLVQLALDSDLDILTDKRYSIAKTAVIRRVQSYKDSMVTSDVWTTAFKEQVDTHEHWTVKEKCVLDTGIKCEACRANKPARYEVKLDSDNSSSSRTLYLGSECRRKGEMYHKFFHFELHMYNHIQQVVTGMMFKNPFLNKNTVHEALIQSGFIKNKAREVKDLFSSVNQIYNLKSQRSRIVDDTSSSSSDYSSYEDS